MKRMTAQEVERQLGARYAETLRNNPHFVSVQQDCQDVINTSLDLLEHYNKVTMAVKSKTSSKQFAGLFS